jgi:zinc protease
MSGRRSPPGVLLALAGLLLSLIAPACRASADAVAPPEVHLGLETFTLPNGLEVILRKDDRLPIAAINIWYHVGAADEAPNRKGFAHLFEHMMFEGSGHVTSQQFETLLESAGADNNASTSFDFTNYFETVASNQLELALWLESERMGFLLDALDQANLSNQQAVVRNERRQTRDNAPYALAQEEIFRMLYPEGHPYRARIMASHDDIQSAELGDVRAFFKTFYVPNNATLAIAGNIDIPQTKAWIQKYFSTIPRGADVKRRDIRTPPLEGEQRKTMTDRVQLPAAYLTWLTPAVYQPGDAEADVAARLLGGGNASRLYRKLVHDRQIAQSVYAYQLSLAGRSVFQIGAVAKPGHDPRELEAAIQEELVSLGGKGPTAREVKAAKTAIIAETIRSIEPLGGGAGLANLLNRYNQYAGRPDYINEDLARYEGISARDVQSFVRELLPSGRRVVVHVVPGEKVLPPEPPTPEPPPPVTDRPRPRESWRNTVPQAGPVPGVKLAPVQHFELDNGIPVFLVESHTLPLVTARLVARAGSAADPPDRPGLATFSASLLDKGAGGLDSLGLARRLEELGSTLETGAGRDESWITTGAQKQHVKATLGLLRDVARTPSFPDREVERVRDEQLVSLQQQADDPSETATTVGLRELYGPGHPYSHTELGTRASLEAITRDELRAFHAQAFAPQNVALVLAGDLTRSEAAALATDAFGDWKGTGTAPPPPGPGTPGQERVVIVDHPGSTQTSLMLAQLGVRRADSDYLRLVLMNRVLGGQQSSRLNLNLRELHGYTYGVGSAVTSTRGVGSILVLSDVETQFTRAALKEALAEVGRMRDAGITDQELQLAKDAYTQSLPNQLSTNSAVANAVGGLFVRELPPDFYATLAGQLGSITTADVNAAARTHLRPEAMKIIAVGDRSRIEAQLQGLGKIGFRTAEGLTP